MQKIGKYLARLLFDHYMRELIDEYVRREHDKWLERFDYERNRSRDLQLKYDQLMRLQMDTQNLKINPFMEIK